MTTVRRRSAGTVVAALAGIVGLIGAAGCSSVEFPGPDVTSALTGAGRPSSSWVMDDPEDPGSFSARFVTADQADGTGVAGGTRTLEGGAAPLWMSPADEPTAVRVSWRRDLSGGDSARACRELAEWLAAEVVPLGVAIKPDETQAACAAPDVSDLATGSASSDIVDGAKSDVLTPPDGRDGRYAVSVLSLSQRSDAGGVNRRELYVALGFEMADG